MSKDCIRKDYYPFGMQMPGRISNAGSYRYGFNGKEIDSATYGQGNEYDYGFRIYNPRIGRFLTVDPITDKYPELTPYQFASNRPIDGIDQDGLEWYPSSLWFVKIYIKYKFGDPLGVKGIKSGIEDKYVIQSGQADYHNDKVPKSVQEKLDSYNDKKADAKIIKGVAKLTKASVETSFNISSSFVPLEEGFTLIGEGLFTLAKYSPEARSLAIQNAEKIIETTSKGKLPRAVTVIVDNKTGRVYTGVSGGLKDVAEKDINTGLKELFPKKSLEKWDVTNCSECHALNQALNDGAKTTDLEMHTVKIDAKTGKITDFERCQNCKVTTQDIKTTSDPK